MAEIATLATKFILAIAVRYANCAVVDAGPSVLDYATPAMDGTMETGFVVFARNVDNITGRNVESATNATVVTLAVDVPPAITAEEDTKGGLIRACFAKHVENSTTEFANLQRPFLCGSRSAVFRKAGLRPIRAKAPTPLARLYKVRSVKGKPRPTRM